MPKDPNKKEKEANLSAKQPDKKPDYVRQDSNDLLVNGPDLTPEQQKEVEALVASILKDRPIPLPESLLKKYQEIPLTTAQKEANAAKFAAEEARVVGAPLSSSNPPIGETPLPEKIDTPQEKKKKIESAIAYLQEELGEHFQSLQQYENNPESYVYQEDYVKRKQNQIKTLHEQLELVNNPPSKASEGAYTTFSDPNPPEGTNKKVATVKKTNPKNVPEAPNVDKPKGVSAKLANAARGFKDKISALTNKNSGSQPPRINKASKEDQHR